MTLANILIITGIIAGILLLAGLFGLTKKKIKESIDYETIEILTLEMAVRFFKQPEMIKILQEDKNLLAVAIKDDSEKTVVLSCFDKEKNEIVSDKSKGYKYQKLNDDLVQMFGNKDMLILE